MPDVVGTGFRFPFQFDNRGRVATSIDQSDGSTSPSGKMTHLYECLYQLIQTAPRERMMRTGFGCGVHDFVFEPNDDALDGVMLYYIADVITRWDTRVALIGISSSRNQGKLTAVINFRIRDTKEIANVAIQV